MARLVRVARLSKIRSMHETIAEFGPRYRAAASKGVKPSVLARRDSCRVNENSFCAPCQGRVNAGRHTGRSTGLLTRSLHMANCR